VVVRQGLASGCWLIGGGARGGKVSKLVPCLQRLILDILSDRSCAG
jgi:hypothetical protein